MVSWALANTLAFPVGLFLLRHGINYYRSIRAAYALRKPTIREAPPKISRALNLLFITAVVALCSTLPYFSLPNIFVQTRARYLTSTEVIFTRLAALHAQTPLEAALKPKLASKSSRLIYFAYGPHVLADCQFCIPEDRLSYLYYALPSLLAPHFIHLIVLGFVTSSFFSGREGYRWRIHATIAGVGLAAVDFYMNATYDVHTNSTTTKPEEIDFFFWRMRVLRGIAIAAVDGVLGWVMWLSATNRFFLAPPTAAERLEEAIRRINMSNFRLWATGNMRNAVVRDKELREKMGKYWMEEKEVYEEREVVDGIKDALSRIDMQQLSDAAESRSRDIMSALPRPQQPG